MCTGKKSAGISNRFLLGFIRGYQKWISPMMMPRCRFIPSCSEYALQALSTHSTPMALWLIVKRLLRCQPLCAGGYDPVPSTTSTHCQDNHG